MIPNQEILATPRMQALAELYPDRVPYVLWLINEASGKAIIRFRALQAVLSWEGQEEQDWIAYATLTFDGLLVPYVPNLGKFLLGYDTIDWAPSGRLGKVDGSLYMIRGEHDFEPGEIYDLTGSYGRGTRVLLLHAFEGGDLVAQSNRHWARENLAKHVAFTDDGVIVPAYEPLHADVIETLEALESYPLLDESHHSQLEMEAEEEAWRSYGSRDWTRHLQDQLVDRLVDDLEPLALDDPTTSNLVEEQLTSALHERVEAAIDAHAETVWSNIRQWANENLWDEERGFDFDGAVETMDRQLTKNDLIIAPILLSLGLPINSGDARITCSYCGRVLHQHKPRDQQGRFIDIFSSVWVDEAGNSICPSPDNSSWRNPRGPNGPHLASLSG